MIAQQLASALGRKDEQPNIDLAIAIVDKNDHQAIEALIDLVQGKNKDYQNDSIKVLYEVGERNPNLIAEYIPQFITGLSSKNNRLQWGSMAALRSLINSNEAALYAELENLQDAANKGSVITKDNFIGILVGLMGNHDYHDKAFDFLIKQLETCPTNQLPMYAEMALSQINQSTKDVFIDTLNARLDEIEKESKKKRVLKVIQKLNK
ncbi:hypothetical protein [Sphingobacterium kyonggiense]